MKKLSKLITVSAMALSFSGMTIAAPITCEDKAYYGEKLGTSSVNGLVLEAQGDSPKYPTFEFSEHYNLEITSRGRTARVFDTKETDTEIVFYSKQKTKKMNPRGGFKWVLTKHGNHEYTLQEFRFTKGEVYKGEDGHLQYKDLFNTPRKVSKDGSTEMKYIATPESIEAQAVPCIQK